MTKRIRYNVEGNTLTSRATYGQLGLKATIDSASLTFTIADSAGTVVATGEAETLQNAKSLVKANLVALGVAFEAETRKHTNS